MAMFADAGGLDHESLEALATAVARSLPISLIPKFRHPDLDWVWVGFSGILIGA